MKIFIACLLLFITTLFPKVVNATIINDIKIDNNNRISKETIITYGKIELNKVIPHYDMMSANNRIINGEEE